ncbi:hypothetical protein [Streptomyces sp. NRRL S-237]|uniref:HalD/BesD family halogenase n=1 Tax=Streptomyces sp. NRRL S-237 TaxID=1463895 RepID=UPI0004C92EDB|nr:hypothetical protein [Streptomyces sp. NRRL S-237]
MLSLPEFTTALHDRFTTDGYLPLPALVLPNALPVLDGEVRRLEKLAVRRDFTMECMNDSPRRMTALGGHVLAGESELIAGLYSDKSLLGRIAAIAAVPVRDPLERHVINILHHQGDTHGAHTDDYPLALVLFTEAPADPGDGGLLEYAPHAADLQALDTVARRADHRPGDGYLLRNDTTAHRVTPLRRTGLRRAALNFAYTTPGRQEPVTPSASQLY